MLTTSPVLPRLLLETYAPPGTRRRIYLNLMRRKAIASRILARSIVYRQIRHILSIEQTVARFRRAPRRFKDFLFDLRHGRLPEVVEDTFSIKLLNRFLSRAGLPLLNADPAQASAGETGAARYILARYLDDADLRSRHRRGLSEDSRGDLCRELCGLFEGQPEAAANIRAVFDRKLGSRPRQAFDHFEDWPHFHPLAFTPAGTRRYLEFLLCTARGPVALSVEEIVWFHVENSCDPLRGIAAMYLRIPSWQFHRPHGLTAAGFDSLREWIVEEYRLKDAGWIWKLPAPEVYDEEQSRRLRFIAHPEQAEPPYHKPAIGVNVLAHFRYPSGLQEAAANTVKALQAVGMPHLCRDVPVAMSLDQPGREHLLGQEVYDFSLLHLAPIPNPALHYPKTGLWARPGVRRAGVWYWELEVIPEDWPTHAKELSEIWAPTRFIHQAMSKVMPVPVVPMLPGVPMPIAPDLPRARFGLDPDKFLFMFMFDMNSMMERKNPLALIEAYRRAFGSSRGTQLAIKVSRGHADPDSFAKLTKAAASVGAVLINSVLTREECYGLMNCCDAYVSLHRSEGFGLTIAEAMLLGKPVVATGYSGNLDFNTPDNCCLIPHATVPITHSCNVYPKGGHWADPSVAHAAEAMKWIVEDRPGSAAMAERGLRDAKRTLSLEAYGRRIRSRLEQLRNSNGASHQRKVA